MQDSSLSFHVAKQRCRRIWRQDGERCAFEAVLFNPLGGAGKNVLAVMVKAENERPVHLDAVVVQDAHPTRVVGGLWRFFMRVGEIVVGKRFEADEHAGASGQRHVPNEAGIVGDVDGYGRAPNLVEWAQRGTQRMQVIVARAQVVVNEDRVGLAVFLELGSDLLGMAHAIRHAQAVGREIAEAAAVVASAGGDQTGGGEKTAARKKRTAGRRITAVVVLVGGDIARLQVVFLYVMEDARPQLHSIAEREGVGMRRAFLGTRQNVQPAEDYLRSPGTIPIRQLVGAAGKRQMYRDSYDLRHRPKWRPSVEQILVPILDAPVCGSRRGKAGQGKGRREHVLAEARIRVLGIEGIDQQGIVPLDTLLDDARVDRLAALAGIERGSGGHFTGNPALQDGTDERVRPYVWEAILGIACAIRASVVSRPSTSSVSNNGGAFLRPQTATRMGWNICPAFRPSSCAAARRAWSSGSCLNSTFASTACAFWRTFSAMAASPFCGTSSAAS